MRVGLKCSLRFLLRRPTSASSLFVIFVFFDSAATLIIIHNGNLCQHVSSSIVIVQQLLADPATTQRHNISCLLTLSRSVSTSATPKSTVTSTGSSSTVIQQITWCRGPEDIAFQWVKFFLNIQINSWITRQIYSLDFYQYFVLSTKNCELCAFVTLVIYWF